MTTKNELQASELQQQVHLMSENTAPHNTYRLQSAHKTLGAKSAQNRVLPILSFLVGLLLASAFLVWTIISFSTASTTQPHHRIQLGSVSSGVDERTGQPASWFNGDCGTSAAQARARNCIFDIVSHSWLPPACYNTEDAADAKLMYADAHWHWGLDNLTEVSLDSVRLGEFERVWTSMDWHSVHCSYIWKRLHRALLDGRRLDSYTADYDHTAHCVRMISGLNSGEPINATGTRGYTKFPTCL